MGILYHTFSSYQKWAPPFNFGVDIQFLKRIFEESQHASLTLSHGMTSAAVINNDNISLHATTRLN
jgi:hypothetical protein